MPFALKVVWFSLSILGIVASWTILTPLARLTGSTWAPLLYCVAVSIMQIMFCIGMVWCMNPARMPHGFCVAQVAIMSLAACVLTGVCAALTIATSVFVFNPKPSPYVSFSLLRWRPVYLIFILAYPVAALVAHLTVIIKFDAVNTFSDDNFECDATDPLWTRLVGYAGVPLLLGIPGFIVSLVTAHKIRKAQRYADRHSPVRTASSQGGPMSFTSLPARISRRSKGFAMATRNINVHGQKMGTRPMNADLQQDSEASLKAGTLSAHHNSSHDRQTLTPGRDEVPLAPPSRPPSHSHPTLSISTDGDTFSRRSASPSPITFAPVAPLPARPRPAGFPLGGSGGPSVSSGPYSPSFPDPGALTTAFPGSEPSEEGAGEAIAPPTEEAASGTRSPVAFDQNVDSSRGFHLPLRPSLELSPEYALVAMRQEEIENSLAAKANGGAPDWLSSPPPQSSTKWIRDRRYRAEDVKEVEEEDNVTLDTLGWSGSRTGRSRNGSGGGGTFHGGDEEGDFTVEGDHIRSKEDYDDYEDIEEAPKERRGGGKALDRLGLGHPSPQPPRHDSPSRILLKLVVFQMGFFVILAVASVSTLIDVIKGRAPMSFGSQHVAMLLAAWWPAIVFGRVPRVCRRPWRS